MKRGKIRDVYKLNDSRVLIITTDRVSAFDEVMSNPIADKGKILNSLTLFWMQLFEGIVDNHLTGQSISEFLNKDEADFFEDRAVVAELLEPLALESVVRGFLEGSAWEDYEKSGFVCGFKLPVGLRKGAKLPEPIFTPALKVNERGGHDRNLSYQECCEIFGAEKTEIVKTKSIELFNKAALFLKEKNISLLDTKFEFAFKNERIVLIDEVLTPDSSRFRLEPEAGRSIDPNYLDKQIIRDYLVEQKNINDSEKVEDLPLSIKLKASSAYRYFADKVLDLQSPSVGVVMGSDSDWSVMKFASETLNQFSIIHETKVISAHRTPDLLFEYAEDALERGLKIIIAGAGGAAHLPGMIASKSIILVFGVPIPSTYLNGEDSLYSIVQMPKGVPVATFAIGKPGAVNAALKAVAVLARDNLELMDKLLEFRLGEKKRVAEMNKRLGKT